MRMTRGRARVAGSACLIPAPTAFSYAWWPSSPPARFPARPTCEATVLNRIAAAATSARLPSEWRLRGCTLTLHDRLRGNRRRADGVVNVEAPPQLVGGVTIEDAQNDADTRMDRASIEADLEAHQIVVHERRDGGRLLDCRIHQRVRDGRIRDHYWNILLADHGEKLIVRVLFDDQHGIVLPAQPLHEVIADAAQPTYDHVADEPMPAPPENDLSTPRNNPIEEQREKHRDERHRREHRHDTEDFRGEAGGAQADVAETRRRGHGHDEVHGGDPIQVFAVMEKHCRHGKQRHKRGPKRQQRGASAHPRMPADSIWWQRRDAGGGG